MAHIKDLHSKGLTKLRKLLVNENGNERYCVIRFPNSVQNNLKNAVFNYVPCITSAISLDRLKANETLFSNETLVFTILFEDIKDLKDTTNKLNLIKQGFKEFNATVLYNNKSYVVKQEKYSEFANLITLYCDTKG